MGHRQSDEHWNCFKGNRGETPETWGGTHMGFSARLDSILNSTQLNQLTRLSFLLTVLILELNRDSLLIDCFDFLAFFCRQKCV